MDFFTTPAFALAVIFVAAAIYTLYAKIKAAKDAKVPAKVVTEEKKAAAPIAVAAPGVSTGNCDVIGTDEKTAAVIMAIVSHKSGIELNRLSFKSIKLMEDK